MKVQCEERETEDAHTGTYYIKYMFAKNFGIRQVQRTAARRTGTVGLIEKYSYRLFLSFHEASPRQDRHWQD